MKPGSSSRCKSKVVAPRQDPAFGLRCNRQSGHNGDHQAKKGKETLRWPQ